MQNFQQILLLSDLITERQTHQNPYYSSKLLILCDLSYSKHLFTRIIYTMKIFVGFILIGIVVCSGLTFTELQEKILEQSTSPFVSMMVIYDGASKMGPILKQAIEQIMENKKGYFKAILVDCDTTDQQILTNFPYCGKDIRPKLPALLFTEPSLNPVDLQSGKNYEPKAVAYQGKLQEKSLYDFAIPLMKLYSINLKKSVDWQKFQNSYPQTPKMLYFTDKDKISPFYKLLTAHFRNTIAFAHIFKNSSLCEELGVTTFPSLLLNGETQVQMKSNLLQQVQILKQFEGPQAKIVIDQFKQFTKELNADNLQQKIYENPRHILVHIPGTNGQPHPQWKKSQDSFKRMFDYFQTETLASQFGVKHRPAIIYFPKSLAKKNLKKSIFYSNDNFRAIYDEIASLIEDFTVPLSDDREMQQMSSIGLKEGKLIAVLFHKEDISLSYRVLSNDERFKEQITFFRMKDPQEEVMRKFQVKKLPALFIMTVDNQTKTETKNQEQKQGQEAFNLQLAQFTGKYNYDELEHYLNNFIQKPEQQIQSTKELTELNSKSRFQKTCAEGCFILLVDNSPQKQEANKEYINTLKIATANVYQNVGYLDGKCHSQSLTSLQIYAEELPALIFLNAKFEKYSRLIGRIQPKAIEAFIIKVKGNKGIWKAYSQLAFEKKDCAKQHEKLKQFESQGSTMTAQEAEILEQIKREAQIKNQQVETSEKASKKKRRKRRPKQQESEL